MKRSNLFATTLAVALAFTAAASAKLVGIGESSSLFQATGPVGLKINGSASAATASENDGKIVVSISLSDIKTGIGLRDRHTKKYLKVDQYPNTTLVVERSKLTFPADMKAVSGDATGEYTLAGVKKPLSFHYDVNRTGSDYHVTAKAVIDIRRHGIETPCYLGVCVDPNVKIIVALKLREVP